MTVNDTTYFLSDPHQWQHPLIKNKWQYTFKFLYNTSNRVKKNYSIEEITNILENKNIEQLNQKS